MKNKTIKTATAICVFLLLGGCHLIQENARTPVYIGMQEDEGGKSEESSGVIIEEVIPTNIIYIQVCGCVQNPGVFKVKEGTRLYEVLELAGGVTTEGSTDFLWLARVVKDGDRIYVPGKDEITQSQQDTGLVNINTDGKEKLMTLPGIGESRAQDIMDYREKNGYFQSVEDIMNVPGIKENAFNKLKDKIIVE